MPTWGIHLATANQINRKLNMEMNSFLLGNILPDVPNNYIVKNITNVISYEVTHYININTDKYINLPSFPDINLFIDKYKDKLNNPLVIGYLVHLLTDLYWNTRFVNDYLTFGVTIPFNSYKQKDLKLFEDYIVRRNKLILPSYEPVSAKKCLKLFDIDNDNIIKTIDYIHDNYSNRVDVSAEYLIMPQNELINIYQDSIEYILNQLEEIGII